MKEDTKKILVVGGAGLLALMVLGGKDVGETVTNIFEAPEFPGPSKDSGKEDPTAAFVSPDPDMTYKQWSAGYQKSLVEKYPIKSIKRPDIDLTILDVLNVGGEDPAGIVYDVPTAKPTEKTLGAGGSGTLIDRMTGGWSERNFVTREKTKIISTENRGFTKK